MLNLIITNSTFFILTALFMPMWSSLLVGFLNFGDLCRNNFLKVISIFGVGYTFFCSCVLGFVLFFNKNNIVDFYIKTPFHWMSFSQNFEIGWVFHYDFITGVMFLVVSTVSLLVHIYSLDYMKYDPSLIKFLSYLSMFTFFMLFLVISGDLIQLFIGWEGVGICSYLLINFWYTRVQANKAALKAVLVNKIGDCAFIFACGVIYYIFGDFNIVHISNSVLIHAEDTFQIFIWNFNSLGCICFFLFIAAMAKSALFGLHVWLPDAMEGPTPVSALIHAATMVTAGIYLIIRLGSLFLHAPDIILDFVTFIGGATCFLGASVALVQYDIKKIIAYSTCSQLGYMVMACGLGQFGIALFHLTTHAFFKALLFLGAGVIIHFLNDEQDIRRMGGLKKYMPNTYIYMVIASLALGGFPFLSGFYSKELILELGLVSFGARGFFSYWLGLISAMFTAFYSTRLLYYVFFGSPRNYYNKILSNTNSINGDANSFKTDLPLVCLVFLSVFVGAFSVDFFTNLNYTYLASMTDFTNSSNLTNLTLVEEAHHLPWNLKIIPLVISFVGAYGFYVLTKYFNVEWHRFLLSPLGLALHQFLLHKWYFDYFYNRFINLSIFRFAYHVAYKEIEKGWLEFIGPTGLVKLALRLGRFFSDLQTGFVHHYAAFMVFGTVCCVGYCEYIYFFSYHG